MENLQMYTCNISHFLSPSSVTISRLREVAQSYLLKPKSKQLMSTQSEFELTYPTRSITDQILGPYMLPLILIPTQTSPITGVCKWVRLTQGVYVLKPNLNLSHFKNG